MNPPTTQPSLATRITAAAVLVALGTVLMLGLGAGVLLHRQQVRAQQALTLQLLSEQARRIADRLDALHERMEQAAASSLIATALVDSAGKELYLQPYLQQLDHIGGTPVAVMLTDFEGNPIATTRDSRFDAAQRHWLAQAVQRDEAAVALFGTGEQAELGFVTLVRQARTAGPKGALVARLPLAELVPDARYEIVAPAQAHEDPERPVAAIPATPRLAALSLGVRRKASAQEAPPLRDDALILALGVLGVTLVLATATGRFFARRLTRDLDTLVAAAARMQNDQRPDAEQGLRLPRAQTREIDMLNQRLNALLDQLQQAHRSQIEAEQARAAQALSEAANRQKSLFMARVSHELRTPLNAILGFSELLAQRTALEPLQREWLQYIDSAGQHLLALVNDLLDISRIESGALELQIGTVPLGGLLDAALRDLEGLARREQVALHLAPLPPALGARADATRLRQVVQNLVSNAIKYNRPGGQVHLRAHRVGEEVELVVEDDGLGMDEQQLAQLFQPFNRLGRERSRTEGTGIGLVLSRSLVESMHGSISVHSRPEHGSRFGVRLPYCAVQHEEAVEA
ncbi:sensor histidine kinase [Azohydromonas caseinilytica]|uniref:histidine kinase n=1 Tax=Azohydromonas caseinilytica TaxID=2728836 RepID=A0A848FH77_9BURK|nr:HAMP domain-containing sensor histidine kinase [Azohydromonas caseinilytica]NML18496.1 hypothetical protein [Azohydromonas caseinilytica]